MKKAIVLAGGKGTRLRPYTVVFPKPMLPIGGLPILETILRQLFYFGFDHATISLGYMAEIIQSYFNREGLNKIPTLTFHIEDKPLGTSGPIKSISPSEEDFLVMNGDILSTLNLRDLFQFHVNSGSLLTLSVRNAEYELPLGVVEMNDEGIVTGFREKPKVNYFDNIGFYVYNHRVLNYIPENEKFDVNQLVETLLQKGEKVSAFVSNESYYWIDIGRHGDYEKANDDFEKIKHSFPFLTR